MPHTAKVELQTTVADLQEVSRRLQGLLRALTEGPLRDDLQQMKQQADAAISYYHSLLPAERPAAAPDVAKRAAEAAVVPLNGVGLRVPGVF